MNFDEIIIKQDVMYGYSCVLYRHDGGFAWSYRGSVKNLGMITREEAVKRFDSNFALDIR